MARAVDRNPTPAEMGILFDAQGKAFQVGAYGDTAWNASSFGPEHRNWNPGNGSPDSDNHHETEIQAGRGRDLQRNEPVHGAAISALDHNVVGTGLRLRANPDYRALGWDKKRAVEWARIVTARFRSWFESTDVDVNRESVDAVGREMLREEPELCVMEVREGVAVIPVIGPTFRYASWMHDMCGATSYDAIARDFNAALEDPGVHSILFEINSPGGEVTGCDQTSRMIRDARGRKPITAYVEGDGCSAAYWLASACDHVAIDTTGEVGSIGVVGIWTDTSAADEKAGVKRYEIVSSVSPGKRPDPSTDAGRAQLQGTIDDLADVFVDAVAANRGRTRDEVLAGFGQGGCFVGAKAVAAGLADEVSTFDEVLDALIEQGREMRDANASRTPGPQQTIPGARRATAKGRTMPTNILREKLKAAGKTGAKPTPRRTAGKKVKGKGAQPAAEQDEDEEEASEDDETDEDASDEENEDEGAEGDEGDEESAEGDDEDEEGEDDGETEPDEDEEETQTKPKAKKAGGERGRIQAIMTSNAGKAQPELASFLAFETGLSPKTALGALKAAASDGSGSAQAAGRGGKRGQAFREAVAGRAPKVLGRQGNRQPTEATRDVEDMSAGEALGREAARFAQKAGEIPAGRKADR